MQTSKEPGFDFLFNKEYVEVQKQGNLEDYDMFFEDEEFSGFNTPHPSPSKNKRKKGVVSRKDFLDLEIKIDEILIDVSSQQPPQTSTPLTLQSFGEGLASIKVKEKWTADRILIHIEMGTRQLDQQRQSNHKELIKKVEYFLYDIKELKDQLIKMTNQQELETKLLINEINKAYEVGYS